MRPHAVHLNELNGQPLHINDMSSIMNYFYQIYENVDIMVIEIVSIKYFESDFLEK
jgi:hypothetical protein